jgi:DNA invertase Pin-like site-specific DNA recombinase
MRAALYARVSTADQRTASQLDSLRTYALARRLEVADEYIDHGVSGAKEHRPALDRLVSDAKRRRFDVLVVSKLDRLARSVRHLVNLTAELEALGVDLVVLDQGLDTSTPAGKLLFHVLSAIAEFERDLIRERVTAGMKAAKRRGAKLGRPRATDERTRERIVRLRRSGAHTVKGIAALVQVSRATVERVLASTS